MLWIQVCKDDELVDGQFRIVENEDGDEVLVARAEGELLAVLNECSHDRRGFDGGCIEAGLLVCPRHGARFCLRTGKALTPPAYTDIATFPVKVEKGIIYVQA
ncbi:Rieske (2Fe-2S) protein [Marinospirillum alkaliphilum]|uniref:3-phenylpropionate/trans-cinnamate dioxygenase ferredoxin subunit n=1 Tax=Marinospirillum alkaliphilum DSM 21637 TaxID=1122209 RepID=A0A1K1V7M8_9GAMM|nr:Rieske 2Fe-2S domain-containing protein [Marinospirillum alkaliphilum]SFX21071.1 3-phenylpropionate/trans-cinnamate dioxygenase ferredoxin subunit [Marinospirillum alkaliphilum DSM 21637]